MSRVILPGVIDSITRGYKVSNSLSNIEYTGSAYDSDIFAGRRGLNSSFLHKNQRAVGNSRVFTFSTWFKRNTIEYDFGGNASIIYGSRSDYSGGSYFLIWLDGNDQLRILDHVACNLTSQNSIRDTSSWYHLTIAVDTTQATDSNRVRAWLNGNLINFTGNTFTRNVYTSVSQPFNSEIGVQDFGNSQVFDGDFADTILVDGLSLDYTSFTEFDSNSMLVPKQYTGSYGKTGFHLKYNDTSSVAALGKSSNQTLASGGDENFGAVSLLLRGNTAGSGTFTDSSSNNFSITAFGDVHQGTHSPFYTEGSAYSSSIGSAYFDGTGDYLEIPDSEAFNFGSGNWTIEYWARATGSSPSTSHPVINQSTSGASSDSSFFIGHGSDISVYLSDGTGWDYFVNTSLQNHNLGAWQHVAVVRNGTDVSIYVDGISAASMSVPSGWTMGNSSRAIQVGFQTGGSNYRGYLSNLRVVKGSAIYNSNFTRPTSPLSAIANTSLLLNFANTAFPDSAVINNFQNVGGVSVNTSVKKYGTGSIYFNGSSYLKTVNKHALDMSYQANLDFTIEAWINTTDSDADLVSAFNATSPYKGYLFGIGFGQNDGKLKFYSGTDLASGSQTLSSNGTVNNGQWRHVAVTREGAQLRFYIDGVLDSTHGIWLNPFASQENIHIGADKNSTTGRYYTGYIDNLRITHGIARYTGSSFTLPSDEFPEFGLDSFVPINMFLHNGERINNPTYGAHRYWRYVESTAIQGHHPRLARIILSTATSDTTIYTDVADNRSDGGTVAPGTKSYDFGSPVTIVNAKIWSSYGDGTDASIRSAFAFIQYSDDNTSWKTAFGGVISNYRNTGIVSMFAPARSNASIDSPTLYNDTLVRGNYAKLNHQDRAPSVILRNGGLEYDVNANGSSLQGMIRATHQIPSTGKWYWEAQKLPNRNILVGIAKPESVITTYTGGTSNSWGYWNVNGEIYNNGSVVSSGNVINDYDIIGMLVDSDANTLTYYKNNSLVYTANIGVGPWIPSAGSSYGSALLNFGQKPFAYSMPSGAKTLNTQNFPDPVIKLPNRYFDTKTYTGNGSTQTISGFNFAPNLVWIKDRGLTGNEYWHRIYDTVRGPGQKALYSNTTENEGYWEGINSVYDSDRLTGFTNSGFTVEDRAGGGGTNDSGASYVNWSWKEDAISGFDIVTYTGDASASGRTIAHNLGVTPDMIIIKRLNPSSGAFAGHWIIQHKGLNAVQANSSTFTLSSYTNNLLFTEAAPVNYGYDGQVNAAGGNYVAYLFREVPGFSKFGTYTSNGLANGPYVHTGFAPRFVMWKSTTSGREWIMKDRSRETFNQSPNNARNLAANRGDQENDSALVGGPTNANNIDWMSNGFKMRFNNANMNSSLSTENYIYMAFAEVPYKYARGVI